MLRQPNASKPFISVLRLPLVATGLMAGLLMLSLAACSDSGVDEAGEDPGSYALSIDGEEYGWSAFFFSDTVEGESGCAIYLTNAANAEQIGNANVVGFAVQENTCEEASSSVVAFDPEGEDPDISNQFVVFFYDLRTEMPSIYFSRGGSLDFSVSGDRVTGTLDNVDMARFQFPEEPGDEPELVDVSMDGSFNAERTNFVDFEIEPPTP